MSEFSIEVTAGDHVMYIGIQPPLTGDELECIPDAIHPSWAGQISPQVANVIRPTDDERDDYIEISFGTDKFAGPETSFTAARSLMRGMKRVLEERGHSVTLDEEPKLSGVGHSLFSGNSTL